VAHRPHLRLLFVIGRFFTTMKKFIFWKDESIVSEVEKEEGFYIHYKYALGNIKDSWNSFMGEGVIHKDELIKKINDDKVILF